MYDYYATRDANIPFIAVTHEFQQKKTFSSQESENSILGSFRELNLDSIERISNLDDKLPIGYIMTI